VVDFAFGFRRAFGIELLDKSNADACVRSMDRGSDGPCIAKGASDYFFSDLLLAPPVPKKRDTLLDGAEEVTCPRIPAPSTLIAFDPQQPLAQSNGCVEQVQARRVIGPTSFDEGQTADIDQADQFASEGLVVCFALTRERRCTCSDQVATRTHSLDLNVWR
jgi:hypothetical protein